MKEMALLLMYQKQPLQNYYYPSDLTLWFQTILKKREAKGEIKWGETRGGEGRGRAGRGGKTEIETVENCNSGKV